MHPGHPEAEPLFSDQFAPPTGRSWIDFTPGADALSRLADALEAASASFPVRVVQPDWPALFYRAVAGGTLFAAV